jgi:preprotein translocase subunit SecD
MKLRRYIIILFPILFGVIFLFDTYRYSNLEKEKETAEFEAKQQATTADSIAVMEKFYNNYGDSYQSAKQGRLKLGLDLRGGMYVTLEVDILKLIEESAERDAIDDIFLEVLEATSADVEETGADGLEVFLRKFDEIAKPAGRSLISYFPVDDISTASDETIENDLRDNVNSAIDQAQEVIRQRIDKYGVSEPNIQKQGERRILLELPGVENEAEVRKLIKTTARLEFNLVRNDGKLVNAFRKIDEYLAEMSGFDNSSDNSANDLVPEIESEALAGLESENSSTSSSTATDLSESSSSLSDNPYEGLSQDETQKRYRQDHQFTTLFSTYVYQGGGGQQFFYMNEVPEIENDQVSWGFFIPKDSIAKFQAYLSMPEVQRLLPYNYKVMVEAKPISNKENDPSNSVFRLHGLKSEPELIGSCIVDANKNIDPTTNQWVVSMRMNDECSDKWAAITGANIGKQVAIILDERVYSAPNVQSKITGGNSQITGMANAKEADLLEVVLKAGALQAPVKIIEEKQVGASLGQDSIDAGLYSGLIAFGLVIVFMGLYYNKGGLVADLALLINILLILGFLAALGGTLTLPGIAGIILTIGMAVDANILIFERIREEIDRGRTMKAAIDEGFSKALSAIIDSNITTLITGIILYSMGTGLIKGFALTLIFGIISTLFTAIVVSRAVIELSRKEGGDYSFGQTK